MKIRGELDILSILQQQRMRAQSCKAPETGKTSEDDVPVFEKVLEAARRKGDAALTPEEERVVAEARAEKIRTLKARVADGDYNPRNADVARIIAHDYEDLFN